MILTLYYMYATFIQWWRLGALKNKLSGTLNHQNALVVCLGATVAESKTKRCLENLLVQKEDRIACTVVPKQLVNLSQWVIFPKDPRWFPIHVEMSGCALDGPRVHLLLQAQLENFSPHQSQHLQVEQFGEPVAWRVTEHFEVILKTDLNYLTRLMTCFTNSNVDINHDLKLINFETVDVDGYPSKIKYEKIYTSEQRFKYSYAPKNWRKFVEDVKQLYFKLSDSTHPKIMIENGTKHEDKKVPISEVKPIKKMNSKNTLEVVHSSGHKKRDHKTEEKKREDKPKPDDKPKIKITDDKGAKARVRPSREKYEERHRRRSRDESVRKTKEEVTCLKDEELHGEVTIDSNGDKDGSGSKLAEVSSQQDKIEMITCEETFFKEVEEGDSKHKDAESIDTKEIKDNETKKPGETSHSRKHKDSKRHDAEIEGKKKHRESDIKKQSSEAKKHKDADSKKVHPHKHKEDSASKHKLDETKFVEAASILLKPEKKSYSEVTQSKNLQRQNATSSKESSPNRIVKPPNILVYAESTVAKENVKTVLKDIINKEKYTIYDLPVNTSSHFWDASTSLVIVCGNVTPVLTNHLLQYLVSGGQLLCLCSDLLHSVLQSFTTAEVREHELVRFTYGEWKRVKMMHHIFCYQASPAKKQFSKDSDQSSVSNGSSPVAPRTPSTVDIQHNGKNYTIQVQILGAEETWQTPSLLLATVKNSAHGKAIFSQVHLEVDPTQYQDDENKYSALRESDKARLEILKHILSNHLDIDCRSSPNSAYSPAYFLGRHDLKMDLLNNCESIVNNNLEMDHLNLEFCGKGVDPGLATSSRLPVLILSCPSNFSTVSYFESLDTDSIGRLVIYADVLNSSQDLLKRKLSHGLVVIPRMQVAGKGRSNNTWLSPEGCAMFSLQLHIDMKSTLGEALPLVQHLVMVAVISAVKSIPGLENLQLGLKWPNDLYAYSSIKIGGLVINSVIESNQAVLNIGCGINLNNAEPTYSINEMIAKYNMENQLTIPPLQYEKFFAMTFNEIERILKEVQRNNLEHLYELYYKHWLHSDARISVSNSVGDLREVTVVGIDQCGFLLVRDEEGSTSSVQPDGNSFDMLSGLIAPKIT